MNCLSWWSVQLSSLDRRRTRSSTWSRSDLSTGRIGLDLRDRTARERSAPRKTETVEDREDAAGSTKHKTETVHGKIWIQWAKSGFGWVELVWNSSTFGTTEKLLKNGVNMIQGVLYLCIICSNIVTRSQPLQLKKESWASNSFWLAWMDYATSVALRMQWLLNRIV